MQHPDITEKTKTSSSLKIIFVFINMHDDKTLKLAATGMVTMFVISGLMKVRSFGNNEAQRFSDKTGICLINSTRIVFLAGIIELWASFTILRGTWGKFNKKDVEFGSTLLVLFTILATLVFYTTPFKPYPVLSNLTTISGLLLLPLVCSTK